MEEMNALLRADRDKTLSAIRLVEASIKKYKNFNPDADYTPDELEPYDALSDRFIRAVETAIHFLRTFYKANEGMEPDTLRDVLLYAEKNGLITTADVWLSMRLIRNKIVHDYLPEQLADFFSLITGGYFSELERLKTRIEDWKGL